MGTTARSVWLVAITLAQGLCTPLWIHAQHVDCLIEPNDVVSVSSPVHGVLTEVKVKRGDLVKRRQVLAKLESSVERATLALARARARMEARIESSKTRLELNTQRLERSELLFERALIAADQKEEASAEKQMAEMSLREAMDNKHLAKLELRRAIAVLKRRTIRSPLDGVVIERFRSPGEFTNRDSSRETAIFEIAQLHPLRVEVFAPLSLLGQVSAGTEAHVTIEAPVNSVHRVRVTTVDRVVDSASGTFLVRLELPNPEFKIPAGLKCTVEFLADPVEAAREQAPK